MDRGGNLGRQSSYAAKISCGISKTGAKCGFGMTRQWPSFAGCISMNTVSASHVQGAVPATIWQKMQAGSVSFYAARTT